MLTLTFPRLMFDRIRARMREAGESVVELPLTVRADGDGQEFFVREPQSVRNSTASLRLVEYPSFLQGITHLHWHAYSAHDTKSPQVNLAVFPDRGCSAAVMIGDQVLPLDRVWLPGPGMESWIPARKPPTLMGDIRPDGRFSRYAGALGGDPVHERFRAPSFAIIGVSRIGSQIAVALGKAGVRKLALVDADVLEPHNIDAMEVLRDTAVRAGSAGIPKVDVVAEFLRQVAPEVDLTTHALPVESSMALRSVASSECLVSCPDQGLARVMTALAATAYHRVHLDIGTGVFRGGQGHRPDESGEFLAGADIRLLIGDGCLMCAGGVGDRAADLDWFRQRAGSLRSLNSIAAGYGLFLLERLAAGELRRSTWVRIQLRGDGTMQTETLDFERREGCPLCAQRGAGDDVWARVAQTP